MTIKPNLMKRNGLPPRPFSRRPPTPISAVASGSRWRATPRSRACTPLSSSQHPDTRDAASTASFKSVVARPGAALTRIRRILRATWWENHRRLARTHPGRWIMRLLMRALWARGSAGSWRMSLLGVRFGPASIRVQEGTGPPVPRERRRQPKAVRRLHPGQEMLGKFHLLGTPRTCPSPVRHPSGRRRRAIDHDGRGHQAERLP